MGAAGGAVHSSLEGTPASMASSRVLFGMACRGRGERHQKRAVGSCHFVNLAAPPLTCIKTVRRSATDPMTTPSSPGARGGLGGRGGEGGDGGDEGGAGGSEGGGGGDGSSDSALA